MKEILDARKATHGDFREQFACAQELKAVMLKWRDKCLGAGPVTHVMQEALDQIAHKESRILTGDPNHADHWRDIAGYATCIADMLDEGKEPDPRQPGTVGDYNPLRDPAGVIPVPAKAPDLQDLWRQAQRHCNYELPSYKDGT